MKYWRSIELDIGKSKSEIPNIVVNDIQKYKR